MAGNQIDLLFGIDAIKSGKNIQNQLDTLSKNLKLTISNVNIDAVALDKLAKQLTGGIQSSLGNLDVNAKFTGVKSDGQEIKTITEGLTGVSANAAEAQAAVGKLLSTTTTEMDDATKVVRKYQLALGETATITATFKGEDTTTYSQHTIDYQKQEEAATKALATAYKEQARAMKLVFTENQKAKTKAAANDAKEVARFVKEQQKAYDGLIAKLSNVDKMYNKFGTNKKLDNVLLRATDVGRLDFIKDYRQDLDSLVARTQRFVAENKNAFRNGVIDDGTLKALQDIVNGWDRIEKEEAEAIAKAEQYKAEVKEAGNSDKDIQNQLSSTRKLVANINATMSRFRNLKDYPEIEEAYNDLLARITKLRAENGGHLTRSQLVEVAGEAAKLETAFIKAGGTVDTFGEKLNRAFGERVRYTITSTLFNMVFTMSRKIYQNVVDIDTAMTELRKVTNATAQEYIAFLDGAGERAQALGVSLKEVVNATADYARLGYSIEDASGLADIALMYRNVGDDVNDIDTATKHLISTMQGFGMETKDAGHIVDVFNEVSNHFAVSAGDIGEGLQRSSAAMKAAGNSFEETVAIFTAANTVQQNAEVVGTAMKTMSARIRGAKTELEEMGESTDGLAESTSKLRDKIKGLTGVDIMLDENNFKSTYQILEEISQVWDSIENIDQAAVLDALFGTRQTSIGAGLLENFDIARDALETALKSEGSAQRELDKYLESIAGHVAQLTASFETLSKDLLDTQIVKDVVDILKWLVDALDDIIQRFGSFSVVSVVAVSAAIIKFKTLKAGALELVDVFSDLSVMLSTFNEKVKDGKDTAAALKEITSDLAKGAKAADGQISSTERSAVKLLKWIKEILPLLELLALPVSVGIAGVAVYNAGAREHNAQQLEEYSKAEKEALEDESLLREEIEANNKAIAERQKSIQVNGFNLVDSEEIENLRRENELLEAQAQLQKDLAEQDRQKQIQEVKRSANINNDVWNIGENFGYNSEGQQIASIKYLQSLANLQAGINKYEDLVASGKGDKWTGNLLDLSETNASKLSDLKVKYAQVYAELLQWKNILINETDEESIAIVNAIDDAIFDHAVKASEKIGAIAKDSRFADLIKQMRELAPEEQNWKTLEGMFDADLLSVFREALGKAGISLEDFFVELGIVQNKAEEDITVSVDTDSVQEASKKLEKLSSSLKGMADAFKEQNLYGQLSADTILDVIDAGYAAALEIDKETGAVRLNSQAFALLANVKIAEEIATIQASKAEAIHQVELLKTQHATVETINAQLDLIAAYDAELAVLNNFDVSRITTGLYDVKAAADAAKDSMSKLQNGMNTLLSETINMIKKEEELAKKAENESLEDQIELLEDAKDAAKERWDAEKDSLDDTLDAYEKIIDAQIEALRIEKEADDYERNKADKAKAVSDIQNQLAAIANDDSVEAQKLRLELQQQLADAQEELDDLQREREYDLREQALEDEKDRFKEETDFKKDSIEEQAKAEQKSYEKRIKALRRYKEDLNDEIEDEKRIREEAYDWIENRSDELYTKLIAYNDKYGDGLQETVDQWFRQAKDWERWGATFPEALNNITAALNKLAEQTGIGLANTTTKTLDEIQNLLMKWREKLVTEGKDAEVKIIDDFIDAVENAAKRGLDMTDAAYTKIKDIVEKADIETLKAVEDAVSAFADIADSGEVSSERLQTAWTEYMNALASDDIDHAKQILIDLNDALKENEDDTKSYAQQVTDAFEKAAREGNDFAAQNEVEMRRIGATLYALKDYVPLGAFEKMWKEYIDWIVTADEVTYQRGQNMVNNLSSIASAKNKAVNALLNSDPNLSEAEARYIVAHEARVAGFAAGGVVDYTGPAKVHGSMTNPEVVFNAQAASKLYNYVMNTPDLVKDMIGKLATTGFNYEPIGRSGNTNNLGDINIVINGNADSSTVAELRKAAADLRDDVVRSLNESLARRGIMRSPRTI